MANAPAASEAMSKAWTTIGIASDLTIHAAGGLVGATGGGK